MAGVRDFSLQDRATRLDSLRREAAACRACPLWRHATQTVLGEGPVDAEIMFVGEQPGDHEDRVGRPFVGPAGHVFDGALDDAGIDRKQAFVTGTVKHFKFEPRGKRRLHKKPNASEIRACRPWLFREIEIVKPRLVVALGSTAAQSLMERAVAIGANRGHVFDAPNGSRVFVTVHPSSLLRVPDAIDRAEVRARFVKDLRALGKMIIAPALPRAD